MSRPVLLLLHGWGFDAGLWDRISGALPEFEAMRGDRGYFGNRMPWDGKPAIAVGHSFGSLLLAAGLPAHVPLVAINGFDRFTGPSAIPARVLARMQRRFGETPEKVLAEFRATCGADTTFAEFDRERLEADLALLSVLDARPAPNRPLLVLHGAQDSILPPEMRENVFAASPRITHPDGGHLLPQTHARWCAEQIRALYRRLCP